MIGRGIAISVVKGCSVDTPLLTVLCFQIVIWEMCSPFSGLMTLWSSCTPCLLSSETRWTSYHLMLWMPVNDGTEGTAGYQMEVKKFQVQGPFFVPRREGREVWPCGRPFRTRSKSRFHTCCGYRSTHGHTVLVSWYSRQDSIFTKWRVERFSSRRWFSFHMSNIFKIFCVTAIIVLSNKRVCEWACCSSLIWSCYIERTPNLLCNSVLVRREIQDVGNNAVRDEYDTTETLFPSICSFTLPLCPWAT